MAVFLSVQDFRTEFQSRIYLSNDSSHETLREHGMRYFLDAVIYTHKMIADDGLKKNEYGLTTNLEILLFNYYKLFTLNDNPTNSDFDLLNKLASNGYLNKNSPKLNPDFGFYGPLGNQEILAFENQSSLFERTKRKVILRERDETKGLEERSMEAIEYHGLSELGKDLKSYLIGRFADQSSLKVLSHIFQPNPRLEPHQNTVLRYLE